MRWFSVVICGACKLELSEKSFSYSISHWYSNLKSPNDKIATKQHERKDIWKKIFSCCLYVDVHITDKCDYAVMSLCRQFEQGLTFEPLYFEK